MNVHASPSTLPELDDFLSMFHLKFRRSEGEAALERYVTGLLTELPNKNCDTMATAVPGTSEQRVVYRYRAVKESGLLRIGLQVLIEPIQSICNRIFTASVDAAWHFRRTVRAAFDPSQLCEALNLSESAATEARGTSTPLLGSTPDPSARLPSRASAAARAWPNPCR